MSNPPDLEAQKIAHGMHPWHKDLMLRKERPTRRDLVELQQMILVHRDGRFTKLGKRVVKILREQQDSPLDPIVAIKFANEEMGNDESP